MNKKIILFITLPMLGIIFAFNSASAVMVSDDIPQVKKARVIKQTKESVRLGWKKLDNVDYYQILLLKKKKRIKKNIVKKISTKKNVKQKQIEEGSPYKNYYFHVRACLELDDICGPWSKRKIIPQYFNANWKRQFVDQDGWVGIDPMIAVDPENRPHIAYYDQGNESLKYAHYNGSSWEVETVDNDGNVGEEPGIAVDSNGTPHISYQNYTGKGIRYATKINGSWQITDIDSVPVDIQGAATSIQLDSNKLPHIAYCIATDNDDPDDPAKYLRYASFNGTAWTIEKIRKDGPDVMLAIDGNDVPHLSFHADNENNESLYYGIKQEGSWTFEIIDNTVRVEGDTGIDTDSNNYPHIVYHDKTHNKVKYARLKSDGWIKKTIQKRNGEGEGLKITVDSSNRPNVVYANNNKEILVFAKYKKGKWRKQRIDYMGNPAIAIDARGRKHIAYNRSKEKGAKKYGVDEIEVLKYARRK